MRWVERLRILKRGEASSSPRPDFVIKIREAADVFAEAIQAGELERQQVEGRAHSASAATLIAWLEAPDVPSEHRGVFAAELRRRAARLFTESAPPSAIRDEAVPDPARLPDLGVTAMVRVSIPVVAPGNVVPAAKTATQDATSPYPAPKSPGLDRL
jgi:hypothetical protein